MIEPLNQGSIIHRLKRRDDTAMTTFSDLQEALMSTGASFQNYFECSYDNDSTSTAWLASSENHTQDASNFNLLQNSRSWENLARIWEIYQILI